MMAYKGFFARRPFYSGFLSLMIFLSVTGVLINIDIFASSLSRDDLVCRHGLVTQVYEANKRFSERPYFLVEVSGIKRRIDTTGFQESLYPFLGKELDFCATGRFLYAGGYLSGYEKLIHIGDMGSIAQDFEYVLAKLERDVKQKKPVFVTSALMFSVALFLLFMAVRDESLPEIKRD